MEKIMTHGDIYIPIIMENGETKYLYCEAWSDGYFDGVGYAMLASSNHMEDVIKLNTIFAGSPFYYDPESNSFEAKEGDYIEENFEDSDTENEAMRSAALEACTLFQAGQLKELYESNFAKISLTDKLEEGFGINAELKTLEEVLEKTPIVTDISEIMNFLTSHLKDETIDTYNISSTEYLYHNNQWLVKMYDSEDYDQSIYIPMVIGLLNFTDFSENNRAGCLADPFSYIENSPTQEDFKTMDSLYHYNIANNINMTHRGWNHITPWMEKQLLEKNISLTEAPNNKSLKL
jgi:hypothetical protein